MSESTFVSSCVDAGCINAAHDVDGLAGWPGSDEPAHRDLRAELFGSLPGRIIVPVHGRRPMSFEAFLVHTVGALGLLAMFAFLTNP